MKHALMIILFLQTCTPCLAGEGSLPQVTESRVRRKHTNDIRTALYQDLVPRNTSGVATNASGSLGTTAYKWLKLFIESGYWDAGDIKWHHDNGGNTPIGQGWYPLDGTVINQTNYDAIHGAGSWATYVGSSPLDGVTTPNLDGKYLVGESTLAQHGDSAGNSGNTVNLQHSHTVNSHAHTISHTHSVNSHNHQIFNATASGSNDQYYNSGGSGVDLPNQNNPKISNDVALLLHTVVGLGGGNFSPDMYTSNTGGSTGGSSNANSGNAAPGTNNQLSTAQSIQPDSIKMGAYMRIID